MGKQKGRCKLEQNQEQDGLFSQKRACELTGLTSDLLRVYEKEFNIEVFRTNGGHRRYSQENLELFIKIKDKIQQNGWLYDDVRRWLNGEVTTKVLEDHQVKTNLEKKFDQVSEKQDETAQKLDQLIETFGAFAQLMTQKETAASLQNEQILKFLESPNARLLLEGDNKTLEAKKVEERENRWNTMILEKRIENKLEDEAEELWNQKPESERFNKTLFGLIKTEREGEKSRFIRRYIRDNFESKLKEEFK